MPKPLFRHKNRKPRLTPATRVAIPAARVSERRVAADSLRLSDKRIRKLGIAEQRVIGQRGKERRQCNLGDFRQG